MMVISIFFPLFFSQCFQKASFSESFYPFPNKSLFLRVCSISRFPVFSSLLENSPPFSTILKLSRANSLSLEESKICRLERVKQVFADGKSNVTQMMKLFLVRWKILWRKEKMVVTSIFSIIHNVFKNRDYLVKSLTMN